MTNESMQLLLNVATLVTALISLLTLFEMRKQRMLSMQPDIVLKALDYLHLYYKPEWRLFSSWPYYWSTTNEEPEVHQKSVFSAFEINLMNIGVGTAKNVSYQWEFDIEAFLSMIPDLGPKIMYSFEEGDFNSRLLLNRETNGRSSMTFIPCISDGMNNTFYLQAGEQKDIPFCEVYSQLLSLFFYGYLYPDSKEELDFERMINSFELLPSVKLKILYRDLSENTYSKELEYRFAISSLSTSWTCLHVEIVSD